MFISTGDVKQNYEIIDIVFAVQVIRSHFVRSGGRETLKFLPEINQKLKDAGKKIGASGVIWVDYDFSREKDVQIITAYGTAVKVI
jgi:hypothetical protein